MSMPTSSVSTTTVSSTTVPTTAVPTTATVQPPPLGITIPTGITTVTKNPFFTYIKSNAGGAEEHRSAVQVWNVTASGWSFSIYTGGTYTFDGKTQTNTFHKKHLITLTGTTTIDVKASSMFTKRTTAIEGTNTKRNKKAGEFVTGIKSGLTTGSAKEKTDEARKEQPKFYLQKGYGNKMTGNTLTIIDCSAFPSWTELAQCFANALARGATGVADHSDEFVTGGTWHPTIDFGTPCVYVCTGGTLTRPAKNKALVQVHLLNVDSSNHTVVCQVHHLANAVD